MKGVEPLIAAVFIIIISITGIAIVLESSQPSIGRLKEISLLEEAKKILTQVDNAARSVGEEGEGSTRVLQLSVSDGNYAIDTDKDAVTFSMDSKSQVIGRGVSKIEGNVNMYGELNRVLMNISYSTVNITGGGSFGRGIHSLIIRNDGYDVVNQKQIISISLVPPLIIPVAFTNQYNQFGDPYIAKGGTPSGYASYLNKLGEGLTYDVPELIESGGTFSYSQFQTANISGANTSSADYTANIDNDNYNVTSTAGAAGGTFTSKYNQSQTANITGNASTINQATINSYLNANGDGLTWDTTENQSGAAIIHGVIVYGRQASPGMVYARTYTSPATLGAEYTTVATSSSAVQHIKIKSASIKDEYVTVHLKTNGRLDVLRCTDGCDASADWSLIGTLTGATSSANSVRRGFDVAYEQVSGRAIVVFSDDPTTGRAYYCIWDGTSWSPSSTCGSTFTPGTANEINFGTGGVPSWIRLVEKPGSNEMLLGILDSAGTYAVARWTGNSWTNIVNIGTGAAVTTSQSFDLAWETNSGRGLVVFDKTSLDGTTQYRKYIPGTGWDASDTTGPDTGAGNNNWIELASDLGSNRISMIIADSEADVSIGIWKSNDVTDGFTNQLNIDTAIETTTGKDVATVWSKESTRALFSFTDSNAQNQDVRCWTTGGFSATTSDVGGINSDDVDNIIYVGSPDNGETFALRGDIVDDLVATRWDGLGCALGDFTRLPSSGTLAADLSVTIDNSAPIEFSFAYGLPLYQYQNSVEHNATVSYSETLNSINVSLNFTSTANDVYGMKIYDFVNSNWDASPCQSQSVVPNTYYTIWCNVTNNPKNYNSSDGIVRIRINSTSNTNKGDLKEEYVQYYISSTVLPKYANISVEHNSSTILEDPLSITKINVTTILKTNISSGVPFDFYIYNFSSGSWEPCLQALIDANYKKMECVVLSNPSYYISGGKIRVRLNSSGDITTHQMMEDYLVYQITSLNTYRIEVWHNSSQIADGNISFINATINFTTNTIDVYSLQIYDFANSQWSSANCDSGSVSADMPTMWWCNETSNPMNYNSSDRKVKIRINSTADNDNGLLKEDYVQYLVGYAQ